MTSILFHRPFDGLTHEEAKVVWVALAQFIDNSEEVEDETVEAQATVARRIVERMDVFMTAFSDSSPGAIR
jgi:hypothetical protein